MKTTARIAGAAFLVLPMIFPGFQGQAAHLTDTNRIYAVQSRLSTPNFQLFLNLRNDSTIASSGPLFGPAGGVYALDFLGATLYGTELQNGGTDYFLATIPHEGALEGQGSRVSANPIGFPNVEGLAVAGGVIYATSINFGAHQTRLITIDRTNGVGTSVGLMATDIIIVGLAYDPLNQILYGAGTPFATVSQANLYRIDRSTAAATLVGPLGAKIEGLSWDATLGLIGSFAKLYQINPQTGAATQIGTNDFTAGVPSSFNGIYALAAYVPTNTFPLVFRSISVTAGNVLLTWNSMANVTYRVEARGGFTNGVWTNLSPSIVASGTNTSHTHTGGGTANAAFYRVKTVP